MDSMTSDKPGPGDIEIADAVGGNTGSTGDEMTGPVLTYDQYQEITTTAPVMPGKPVHTDDSLPTDSVPNQVPDRSKTRVTGPGNESTGDFARIETTPYGTRQNIGIEDNDYNPKERAAETAGAYSSLSYREYTSVDEGAPVQPGHALTRDWLEPDNQTDVQDS